MTEEYVFTNNPCGTITGENIFKVGKTLLVQPEVESANMCGGKNEKCLMNNYSLHYSSMLCGKYLNLWYIFEPF